MPSYLAAQLGLFIVDCQFCKPPLEILTALAELSLFRLQWGSIRKGTTGNVYKVYKVGVGWTTLINTLQGGELIRIELNLQYKFWIDGHNEMRCLQTSLIEQSNLDKQTIFLFPGVSR